MFSFLKKSIICQTKKMKNIRKISRNKYMLTTFSGKKNENILIIFRITIYNNLLKNPIENFYL